MLIYLAALQGVPQHLYDAAAIDGAGPWRTFRHVTLPQMTPAILFTVIIGTIYGFQVFTEPFVMTGGVPDTTNFLVVYLYNVAFADQEMGYASALAVILFAVIFIIAYAQIRTSRRWVYYEMGQG
jgi:multiple sugar transport system permease protein